MTKTTDEGGRLDIMDY